jgi:hypothetical protein
MNIRFGCIYCEYKSHVRIHDYMSVMIHNFPIFLIRRYDFDLHDEFPDSCLNISILGFSLIIS